MTAVSSQNTALQPCLANRNFLSFAAFRVRSAPAVSQVQRNVCLAGQRPAVVQDWRGGACQPEESAAAVLLLLLCKDFRVAPEVGSETESLFASEVSHFLPDLKHCPVSFTAGSSLKFLRFPEERGRSTSSIHLK